MINMKSLKDLSLQISEEQYRENPALSYSTLARYEKGGFNSISHLFDRQDSDSLTFGSMVDTIITEGMERFNEKFAIANFNIPSETVKEIADSIINDFPELTNLDEVEDSLILERCNRLEYQPRWKDETRISKIREQSYDYFNFMAQVNGRKIVSDNMYQEALATVSSLKTHPQTQKYLHPFNSDGDVEFLYQQKFKTTLDGLDVKCMFDLIVVSHVKKLIIPIDLKTTSLNEYDFPKRYLENHYDIQSRLYYRILKNIIEQDDYFKDFKICDFRFIVINKNTRFPLVFSDEKCSLSGDLELVFKNGRKNVLRDPIVIGKELKKLLDSEAVVPDGIDVLGVTKIHERIKLL